MVLAMVPTAPVYRLSRPSGHHQHQYTDIRHRCRTLQHSFRSRFTMSTHDCGTLSFLSERGFFPAELILVLLLQWRIEKSVSTSTREFVSLRNTSPSSRRSRWKKPRSSQAQQRPLSSAALWARSSGYERRSRGAVGISSGKMGHRVSDILFCTIYQPVSILRDYIKTVLLAI